MKMIVIVAALLSISSMAQALPICDMKRTAQERADCANMLLNGGLVRMQKNYEKIYASKKIPQSEKDYIKPNHREWAKKTEGECRNNSDCTYSAISSRNSEIEKYLKGYGIQPI